MPFVRRGSEVVEISQDRLLTDCGCRNRDVEGWKGMDPLDWVQANGGRWSIVSAEGHSHVLVKMPKGQTGEGYNILYAVAAIVRSPQAWLD